MNPSEGARSALAWRLYTIGRSTAYAIAPVALLVMIAVGVLYVRLSHGPISFDVLVPPIERGINAELTHASVRVKSAELRFGPSGDLEFRLRNLTVFERDGDILINAPQAAVSLAYSALWRARVAPARVELIDAEIYLTYTDDAGLVIDRAAAADSLGDAPQTPAPDATQSRSAPPPTVNLAKMLSDASKLARRRVGATSYLTEVALSKANVVVQYAGQKSKWRVSEASVDFNHAKRRSVISGRAKLDSEYGPWALSFLTDESEKTDVLKVKATVRDFVPAALGAAAPPFALLKMFQLPISGDATVALSTAGDVANADLAVEAGAGRIAHPDLKRPLELTGGLFRLTFDGKERRWDLAPSPVKWGDGSLLFTGAMQDVASAPDQPPTWRFALDGKNGLMEAREFGVPDVALDAWTVEGHLIPRRGLVDIKKFRLAGGGGEAVMSAVTQAGASGQSTRMNLSVSAMPLATLKALWPRSLAPAARQWAGESVTGLDFQGGSVRLLTGEFLAKELPADVAHGERLSATFKSANATFIPMPGMAPIFAPAGLISLENDVLEVQAPEAAVLLPGDRKVPLKAGRLYSANVEPDRPDGEITFTALSALGPFLEAVEQAPVRIVREAAPFPKAVDGKVEAQFKVKLPLVANVAPDDVKIEGKARVTDGRFGKVAGQFDVQGFTLNLDLTETALEAKGDLLVNGVAAKIAGQRLLTPVEGEAPGIKITANLDEADRAQLGLDVNHLFARRRGGRDRVSKRRSAGARDQAARRLDHVRDLDRAVGVAQGGRPKRRDRGGHRRREGRHKTEMQNLRLSGDDIAVEGWLGFGSDNKLNEFFFPAFTLNVVSRLEMQGARGKDNVWTVKARGPTFDGRDLFRSLFQVGGGEAKPKEAKPSGGVDVDVDIANVLGASETSLRGVKMKLSKRDDKLTELDMNGALDGGAQLIMSLAAGRGPRRLLIELYGCGADAEARRLLPQHARRTAETGGQSRG